MEYAIEGLFTAEEEEIIKGLDFSELEDLESKEEVFEKMHQGRFTASTAFRLMGSEDKPDFPTGAMTYVNEKVLETETTNVKNQLNTFSVRHGKETEVEGVIEFMKATGKKVEKFGDDQEFIPRGKHEGCTPDGLVIGEDAGIEVKCPDSKTHLDRLLNLTPETCKKMIPEYYWQMQDCMRITGRKRWYFIDYDPRFKNENKRLLIVIIERNEEDINKLARRTFTATREYKKKVEFLRN